MPEELPVLRRTPPLTLAERRAPNRPKKSGRVPTSTPSPIETVSLVDSEMLVDSPYDTLDPPALNAAS